MPANAALSEQIKPETTSLNDANIQALAKLQTTVQGMSDDIYTKAPTPGLSPIGGHVRHIIEFYQEFFNAEKDGFSNGLSYDNRQRNMTYETSRQAALEEMTYLTKRCANAVLSDQPISLSMTTDMNDKQMCNMVTTPTRELFHLLDHATHHMALIKMTATQLGCDCDENFGMANSTLAHNTTKDATAASPQMGRKP